MAIRICPECGGKCAMSRNICIHCGHEFKETKKCPECEADVEISLKECPECGYLFEEDNNSQSVAPQTVQNTPVQPVVVPAVQPAPAQQNDNSKQVETPKALAVSGVVCSQCGSGDTTKLDDYTYKCNRCGTIITLERPDTNIVNINSFTGSVDDIPVYQLKQDITEKDFVRMVVLNMGQNGDVSPKFLSNFVGNESMVSKAYITFAEVPYSVDVSYSCQIGTDYTVTYGDGSKKTETQWESFSGNGSDGGISFLCAYGVETKIDFFTPIYIKSDKDEFVPFQEQQKYPLKRRVDRSVQEEEKKKLIDDLAYKCKSELPGHKVDQWRYHGRCNFEPIDTFYYIPSFNMLASSNGHTVVFTAPAVKHGYIFTFFPEGEKIANVGSSTKPTKKTAKQEFKYKYKAQYVLTLLVLIFSFVLMSVSLILIVYSPLFAISAVLGLAAGITMCVLRNKTTNAILNNLTIKFKNDKALACIDCLEKNSLAPLTPEEKRKIAPTGMLLKDEKAKANLIASSVLGCLTIASLIIVLCCTFIKADPSKNNGPNNSITNKTTYKLTVTSEDTSKGTVSGGGSYSYGASVTVTATPKSSYYFDGWYNNGVKVSSNKSYTFDMPASDYELVARFATSAYTFGSYPQTKVTDSSITSSLTSQAGTLPTSSNSQNWTPYNWYINSDNTTKFAWFIDLDTNSDGQYDYRGVYFTSYRPCYTGDSSSAGNSYQDDNGYSTSTVYWFKYEPIEWRILQNNSGDYFVMSNKIIDSEQYSMYTTTSQSSKTDYQGSTSTVYPNNYQYSDLRTFLNTDFYNTAFSSTESSRIKTTTVDNSASTTGYSSNPYACGNTSDKVFALSYSDVINSSYGFSSSYSDYDTARQLKVTDYAACMGCYKYNSSGSTYDGCGNWWLRSPSGSDSDYARSADDYGYADCSSVGHTDSGVVPALHLQ